MRILITGATGFVGSWLARELAAHHPDAVLFGTQHHDAPAPETSAGLTLRTVDLTDANATAEIVAEAKPDMVFHLAGYASAAGGNREAIFRVNVTATETLLRLLTESAQLHRVLVASSGYIYGATEPETPAREPDMPHPQGDYAESKAEMERAVRSFADFDTLALTVVRAFNHTGPGQTSGFAIPGFARQIARIEKGLEPPVVPHGNLMARRDFLNVRDVVRAYRLLVCEAEPVSFRVVNVCSGVSVSIQEALEKLATAATIPVTLEEDPARMRPLDLPECIGDPSFLKKLTGWDPETSFDDTLLETLNWWREN